MRRLLLASDNPGKLREFQRLLAPLGIDVVAQRDFGIASAPEPHASFLENALAKARHAAGESGLPALADDSGLCCVALAGAPGVRSARLAGEGAADAQNNEALLRALAGASDRRAHYSCVLVALVRADDPEPIVADARWHGEIVDEPRGINGFGYDPHFFISELGRTVAELSPEQKDALSHRGRAMRQLALRLKADWSW